MMLEMMMISIRSNAMDGTAGNQHGTGRRTATHAATEHEYGDDSQHHLAAAGNVAELAEEGRRCGAVRDQYASDKRWILQ